MAALWARVVQKRTEAGRPEDRGASAPAATIATRDEVEGSLGAIGMRDETMRARLGQIEEGLATLGGPATSSRSC